MGDVAGKGLWAFVEDAISKGTKALPRCKGAANSWDRRKGLAKSDTCLLIFKGAFIRDQCLVSTALRAGYLRKRQKKIVFNFTIQGGFFTGPPISVPKRKPPSSQ